MFEAITKLVDVIAEDDFDSMIFTLGGGSAFMVVGTFRSLIEDAQPGDVPIIPFAREARNREFIAGRVASRKACEAGNYPSILAANRDGSPSWTAGMIGSISHSKNHAASIISDSLTLFSVGIDIEDAFEDPHSLEGIVMTGEEVNLFGRASFTRADAIRLSFSAKESVFKAHWPANRTFLNFADISLIPEGPVSFRARVLRQPSAEYYVIAAAGNAVTLAISACWSRRDNLSPAIPLQT